MPLSRQNVERDNLSTDRKKWNEVHIDTHVGVYDVW